MITISKILVPTDFSDYSARALEYATVIAKSVNATIHLLHVVEPLAYMTEWGAMDVESLTGRVQTAANEELDKLTTMLRDRGFSVSSAVLTGHPEDEITQYAADHHIDVISMGTHGRRGIEHLLFGSTTERVLRTSPCPVLSVPLEKK